MKILSVCILSSKKILLESINAQVHKHTKQFGFKQNSSCAHAVFILKQIMNLCKQLKKKIYILAIDLTKAFDKVYRPLNMLKRGVSLNIARALITYYNNSMALIEIDGERSQTFRTQLGVKQGGPSSPVLFNFIPYNLIMLIDSLNLGVYVGNMLINIIAYADDTLIVANKSRDMTTMIAAIEKFANENEIEINVKKTYMMSTDKKAKRFLMSGLEIEFVSQIKYLGVEIAVNCSKC